LAKVAKSCGNSTFNPFNSPHITYQMITFTTITDLNRHINEQKAVGKTIGFVPTMGALHQGHLSLIAKSKRQKHIIVCSIFVNPTQFNDPKDFEKYPITIEKDKELLESMNTDILFLPSVKEIYPHGINAKKHYDLGHIETVLDGAYRPGHFQGVCQVVERLLLIVQPTELFLGQKDCQQCLVIKKLHTLMCQTKEIDQAIKTLKISIVPTLRETDGLAMSSRNMRLSTAERIIAPAIYKQLVMIENNIRTNNIELLKSTAKNNLLAAGFNKIDYVEISDAENLKPINTFDVNKKTAVLVAAFLGNVRLIDNIII
jgi:pantoate--beta-alanine ligase